MEESHIISLKEVDSTTQGGSTEQITLRNINLNINAGESVAIIGRSDAGKNALLRCIALLDRPLTGILSIDNKNLTFMASSELCHARRKIAYITAKPTLMQSRSILHNVALPLLLQGVHKDEAYKLANIALGKVNLDNSQQILAIKLSPLQLLQIDLARGLINSPNIILADEIFAKLDPKSAEIASNILDKIKQSENMTLLISTNDANYIKAHCDSVIVMRQGVIVERCSVYELFSQPQSDTAKEFIRIFAKHELPGSLRKRINHRALAQHHALVRINFHDCLAPEEILSNSLDAFDLRMNIIQAYQEAVCGQVLNIMVIEIFGEFDTVEQVVEFLNHNGLHSEIIGYVPTIA